MEKQSREWAAQCQARVRNIERLSREVRDYEATIEEIDRERVAREKQGQGWFSYLANPWAARPGETEQGKQEKARERLEQRASKSIKLEWARKQLTQVEAEHQRLLATQRQTREREAKEREDRLRDERLKAQREEQNARRKRDEDTARAREEACRKAEEAEREAARKAREREAADQRRQETERRERDLRQRLFAKLAAESIPVRKPPQNQNRATHPPPPRAAGSTTSHSQNNTWRQNRRNFTQTSSAGVGSEVCRHRTFWLKVEGRHECSVCYKTFNGFVLQCPDCKIMACASCKKALVQA